MEFEKNGRTSKLAALVKGQRGKYCLIHRYFCSNCYYIKAYLCCFWSTFKYKTCCNCSLVHVERKVFFFFHKSAKKTRPTGWLGLKLKRILMFFFSFFFFVCCGNMTKRIIIYDYIRRASKPLKCYGTKARTRRCEFKKDYGGLALHRLE